MADHPAGAADPRRNIAIGSSGSSSFSSQRGRGRKSFSHSPRGAFRGRSSGINHVRHQVYRPKSKPTESQDVNDLSKFEAADTIREDSGESFTLGGLTQSIESQNVEDVNSLSSNFEFEDNSTGGSGERLILEGSSTGVSSRSEEKFVGSSGSSSCSSQRGRGRKSFSNSPRGTFRGRSNVADHIHHQVYRPKSKPTESQDVNALSKFEAADTITEDSGESLSVGGLTQSIESQNVENINSLASNFDFEYNSRDGSGERSTLDRSSFGVSSLNEEKSGEEEEQCFDICARKGGSGVVLKASLFQRNKERRNEMKRAGEGKKEYVLGPGMVILKNYLSMNDQIKIVKRCRELGLGAGGFYQPGYRDGGRLNLKMMCLGKHWDPDTSMYGDYRPHDNAKQPIIPSEFRELVEGSIKDAQSLIKRNSKGSYVEETFPSMTPDICIVNFYSLSGRLGLHQDKDESEESIRKGLPVVSFSIGDSAEFLYGDSRDVDRAEEVTLESGDVLIFGGKSRRIFHGVKSVQKQTAPRTLLDKTSLRPGRLNLTFRQY